MWFWAAFDMKAGHSSNDVGQGALSVSLPPLPPAAACVTRFLGTLELMSDDRSVGRSGFLAGRVTCGVSSSWIDCC